MMYIVGCEVQPYPNVAVETIQQIVGTTIYGNLASSEGNFQSMLIDTNDRNPHCRWMFVSR